MPADPLSSPIAPPSRRTSILPATIVLAIAVVVLALFAVVDATTSSTTTPTTQPLVIDNGLRPEARAAFFRADVAAGEPPADVATAYLVPVGTRLLERVVTGGNRAGNYDVEVRLAVRAPRPDLLGFYEANLHALGWTLYSTTQAPDGGDELLFQRAGSDGNYWEAGINAQPTIAGSTTYTLRLFVVDSSM